MKKIKVYLQYPWKFPDSPYYKYLINDCSKHIEYKNTNNERGVITNKNKFQFSNFLKIKIRKIVKIFYPSMINLHKSPDGDYDIIHCAHCLSKNKSKPWVADIEGIISLFIAAKSTKTGIKKLNKIISKKNCKKLLPWTDHTKNEILKWIPDFENKIEVLYPAISYNGRKKTFDKNNIVLIFVGRYFYEKGGLHALEVMNRLTNKNKNIGAIFVSDIPNDIKKKYSQNKNIKIYGLMPQDQLFKKVFSNGDIFLYPGYTDSFGFAYLEAMSFGIPTITFDGYARKEIITHGQTGLVIDLPKKIDISEMKNPNSDLINELEKNTIELINNYKEINRMSKACSKEIKSGKFSIENRNKKLEKVYLDALK